MEGILSWGGPEESRWGRILRSVVFFPKLTIS